MSAPKRFAAPIPAGATIVFSRGEYSDYDIEGVFLALAIIDGEALVAEWIGAHPDQAGKYSFRENEFVAMLSERGLIEQIETWTFYLGAYGDSTGVHVDAP